jgi:DNA-directed RNA polymerase specialized sigma24 family protein
VEYLGIERGKKVPEESFMVANDAQQQSREILSRAIVEAISSWPELDRRIFIQVHYEGKSAEEIAGFSGLKPKDVLQVLKVCEWRLSKSLNSFWSSSEETGQGSYNIRNMCAPN